jgi:6-hydroxytryprostatin B O-methyltransferase
MVARDSDVPFFDYMVQQDLMHNFSLAMHDFGSAVKLDKFYLSNDVFDWSALGSGPVVDLGGGPGHLAIAIAKAHPELRLVVQDLPKVEQSATDAIQSSGVQDRISFQVQDFFEPQVDPKIQPKAFFMAGVMHDWADEDALRILRNLMPFVESGAKILVHDRVLTAPGEPMGEAEYHQYFADLLMFSVLGAMERNKLEWLELFRKLDPRLRVDFKSPPGTEHHLIVVGL